MYQQIGEYYSKFRFVLAGVAAIGCLLLFSALVTAFGSGSILDAHSSASKAHNQPSVVLTDTPNAVTAAGYEIGVHAQHALLATGTALYTTCRSVTSGSIHATHSVGQTSGMIVGNAWHGMASTVRAIGSVDMYVLRLPVHAAAYMYHMPFRLVASIGSGQVVSAAIRPADDAELPVITAPSPEVLARLSAKDRQEVATLQAAQIAANQHLDGTIVAGDPGHGGYPARWDNAWQDSTLDSWGMYNRECVSYTAWKVYQTYGHMPYWGGVGNANQWVRDARSAGIATSTTPRVHSVAISMNGYYGHAMWVEAVSGSMIYVSQYNYDLRGHYSEMWINSSALTYIYFN